MSIDTHHLVGGSGALGDPSGVTAFGIYHGIKSAIAHRFGKDALVGVTVAVQGLGHVGEALCRNLAHDGVKLVVSDIDPDKAQHVAEAFGARSALAAEVDHEAVDVFAPCALGGGLMAVAMELDPEPACREKALSKASRIAYTLSQIFDRAAESRIPTNLVAEEITMERIRRSPKT